MKSKITGMAASILFCIATPVTAQTCADKLSLVSSMSETIDCARELAAKLELSEAQLKTAESSALNSKTVERRLTCAKLALNVAKKRLDSNRKYVAAAAGTKDNDSVRNGMLLEWRSSKIPAVDEKVAEVFSYLDGSRNGC